MICRSRDGAIGVTGSGGDLVFFVCTILELKDHWHGSAAWFENVGAHRAHALPSIRNGVFDWYELCGCSVALLERVLSLANDSISNELVPVAFV